MIYLQIQEDNNNDRNNVMVSFLKKFMTENNIVREELAYIGDDLNDYPPMQIAAFVGCPDDSCRELKQIATYVSPVNGGYGAVRDIIEHMLTQSEEWKDAISEVYGLGV